MEQPMFTKYISILYRQGNRYFDRELAPYGIGCGQQFFLLRVHENPGISMYDLARLGHFDKGTVTKAMQRLEELRYIRSEADPGDRRIRRLFVTGEGADTVRAIYEVRARWLSVLSAGMTPEEAGQAERLLIHMAENAWDFLERKGDGPID